jgi:hypothetical protein
MPRPKNCKAFSGTILTHKRVLDAANPKSSWWTGKTRDELREACELHRHRMNRSRFALMKIPTFGRDDPKAGLMRAKFATAFAHDPDADKHPRADGLLRDVG